MTVESKAQSLRLLEKAKHDLLALAHTTDSEIASVSKEFTSLATQTDAILTLAGAIVGSAENESVVAVLPKTQSLGTAAQRFITGQLQATTGILETVAEEVNLLGQLSLVTRGQAAVARDTKVLSVLTNIEAARLGSVGSGFQYVAQQLADFSKSVAADTQELMSHNDERKAATEETRRILSDELPRLRADLAHMQADLGQAVAGVEASLTQLSQTPLQFRACLQDIARQIAGVVAAIQAQDITRQQIEHVQRSFTLISAGLQENGDITGNALPRAYAGLLIQIYQLRAIKQTVAAWATQIRTCADGMLRVSASEIVAIGPAVLEHSREVSSQLSYIEQLQRKSQAYSERIGSTIGGLSSLMQLVGEHLNKSKSVHERLQLLTFNSIIEANRLGKQASAIMAIAKNIEGISVKWSEVTGQSRAAMDGIASLVKRKNAVMEAFSETQTQGLRDAQQQTRAGLDGLETSAAFVSKKAEEMNLATERVQSRMARIAHSSDLLDACSARFDTVLADIESLRRQMELDHPGVHDGYDTADAEQSFSTFYSTEVEREVLHAALRGTALPAAQQTFAGNTVELF